jgi:hypothetical protein
MNRPSCSAAFFQYLFLGCAAILAFGLSASLRAQDAPSAAAAKGSNLFESTSGADGLPVGADSQKHATTSLTMRLSF